MPRVTVKKKNRAGADRECGRCGDGIEPGQEYRSWSFRYGGTHYRCMKPGCRPRQSELTQSKMSEVYSAVEEAEETLKGDASTITVADIRDAVSEAAEAVGAVAEEYREADQAFGGQGATESAERADELEDFASALDNFSPEEETDEDSEAEAAEKVEAAKEAAYEALGEAP